MIKSRRMRREGHIARMGEKRNSYRILVEKPERKAESRKCNFHYAGTLKQNEI
jgi:hypothetical protein